MGQESTTTEAVRELFVVLKKSDTSKRGHAWAEVYRNFEPFVRLTIKKHLPLVERERTEVVDEIVSETFLSAFKSLTNFDFTKPGGFGAWLKAIATNKTVDYLRSTHGRFGHSQRQVIPVGDFSDPNALPGESSTLHVAESISSGLEAKESLLLALGSLTKREQQVVIMRSFFELSGEQISRILGVTASRITQIFSRAQEKMVGAVEHSQDVRPLTAEEYGTLVSTVRSEAERILGSEALPKAA